MKYYQLINGNTIPASEIKAAIQFPSYYALWFVSGSSLTQVGQIKIVEINEEEVSQ
jgi:hypothetical protein